MEPALVDRPIADASGDALDRGPFASSLVSALIRSETVIDGKIGRSSTGFVVGLTGDWGSGKSSILNLVAEELEATPFVAVARLNPWLFKGRDELVAAYFTALRSSLGRSAGELARALVTAVDAYRSSIETMGTVGAAFVDVHGGGGSASWVWRAFAKLRGVFRKPKPRTPDEERKSLEKKLRRGRVAVVVLIDELDRVEDDEVRAVAQLIKAVGEIAGVAYLVAYDPDRVADALGRGSDPAQRRRSGEAYLEKIVQYAVPIRPLFREDVDALLASAMVQAGVTLPNRLDEDRRILLDAVMEAVRTPREIKRLIGTFAVLEAAVRGEVDPVDVLAYSWIAVKSPGLRGVIARRFDRAVDDPSQAEMIRRLQTRRGQRETEVSLTDELGDEAAEHTLILERLFPRFLKGRTSRPDGNRIAYRRNLIRLLYLGNPPGMTSRSDVERLWLTEDRAALKGEFREMLADGSLRNMIGRLGDLSSTLLAKGGSTFWPALSDALRRDEDWVSGFDERRAAVEDGASLLLEAGKTEGEGRLMALRTIDGLIQAGDLLIVPWLLRRHLFVHGLTSHNEARGGDSILDRDETIALYDRELPRYRQAVLDGTMLRRLPDVELLFSILNRAGWDEELHRALTEQLDTPDAVATLASLLLPRGWSIDYATIAELFDAGEVGSRLEAMLRGGWVPENEWVADSVRRLAARLGHPAADAGSLA